MQKPSFQNSGRLCPELNSRTRCQPNVLQPFLSTNKYLSKMESCPGAAQLFIKRGTSAFRPLHAAPVAEVVKRGHTFPNRFRQSLEKWVSWLSGLARHTKCVLCPITTVPNL
ncbi:hypothetical protein CEXT_291531 [Caerostris extrusa]|uniref:Uncharacterized protein n=1 Tax=Caerostris extrusa TaxID=172846 RepID=A0AAV4WBH8_CAEEX|nr:hypothetical protein CEXT_291531 [Caerostris extrusa]